jgi:hypothetical protein
MATFQGTPQAPAAPRVAPVPQVQAQGSTPTATPRTPAVFTPDAQYIAQAAQAQFDRTNQINQLNADADTARNTFQEAVRRLMEGVPEQRQGLKQQANKQGLFYSGILGKRLGDLEAAVARQRADMQGSHDVEQRAREAARAALLSGATLEDAAMQAAAVERQIARDQEAAASNSLAPNPKPKPKKKKSKK